MSNERHAWGKAEFSYRLLSDYLPTGDWEYHCVKRIPLVEYELWNKTQEKVPFTLESEIKGYSEAQQNSLSLEPGAHVICRQLPLFDGNTISPLRKNTRALVSISISSPLAEKPHIDDRSITLMSYNTILWDMQDLAQKGERIFLLKHIVAWIDRDDESVQEMWRVAFNTLEGYSGFPYPEAFDPAIPKRVVEAIFETLRINDALRYDAATYQVEPLSKGEKSQSIQRPGETLKHNLGNCIDGAVLYASIMLRAGMDPVIVIEQGHAFVGWKTWNRSQWKQLSTEEKYDFLETTWTRKDSKKTFDQAYNQGKTLFDEILKKNWLHQPPFHNDGFASLLDIRNLRTRLGKEVREQFSLEKVVEEPAIEKQNTLSGKITRLPVVDTNSNLAQKRQLQAVSDYMIEVEVPITLIRPRISNQMTENDCKFTIDNLDLIPCPNLPPVESILSQERQWAYKLDALWNAVDRLKGRIEALRIRHTNTHKSHGRISLKPAQKPKSLSDPAIPVLYEELLQVTKTIASEIKVAMESEETNTSTGKAD